MKNLIFEILGLVERIYHFYVQRKSRVDIKKFKEMLVSEGILANDHILNIRSIPFFKKQKGSTITIGNNCSIVNTTSENVAGIPNITSFVTSTASAKLVIGHDVGFSGNSICCVNCIVIGNYVNVGAGARIYDTDFHPIDYLERRKNPGFDLNKIPHAPVMIGDDVWIGANAVILKGVSLGNRVIVGAGSVVTKSFPADTVIGGNPAKIIKSLK
ncbi:DapH/DapD/GlmU-related protein [uncultured Imperialibacter sp.]|uniref:DapH/DapD/GlmU-related protein n=1 Tax=uncultured Imperialibacter sp. TaxID=1672639 RepID=UPI0030DD7F22|tara:strand:+ start:114655 stop:115296 length:642 start_codon:yes stop_codon:yes gene_type:complete